MYIIYEFCNNNNNILQCVVTEMNSNGVWQHIILVTLGMLWNLRQAYYNTIFWEIHVFKEIFL